jgi:cytochrome c oxidase assembly protein subunit 15
MEVVAHLETIKQNQLEKNNRMVANWLLIGVIMVIIQIAIGGITRLTGSGLSITEWEVVTGTLPPLSEQSWLEAFDKYKTTPQYQLLNSDFSLADFKFIFFWEWFHRLWARVLGLVFATGFIYFLVTRRFKKHMITPLLVLFALGGLQGFVGWIMVASGLVGDAVYVKPTRLALHFIFALGLLSYTFWFYLSLRLPQAYRPRPVRQLNILLHITVVLLVVQLLYGALMAGHKAASAAPTWPTINGSMLAPAGLYKADHGLLNFVDNRIMVHYVHRGVAYLLTLLAIALTYVLARHAAPGTLLYKIRWMPVVLVGLQVWLGILSVLNSRFIVPNGWGRFEWVAQLHQLSGMCLLLLLVSLYYLTKGAKKTPLAVVA